MEEELVSILIPVYNREKIVEESIESAINQTYKNTEIIIVDNCSTDNTWQVLTDYAKKDSRIKIFRNDKNLGPVLNWKRCLDEANGVYSKILFSDDLISQGFLTEAVGLFDSDTAFVLSKIVIFDQNDKTFQKELSPYKTSQVYTVEKYIEHVVLLNLKEFPVSPGSAVFRSDDLRKALLLDIPNPFNLDFNRYGAGTDLLIFLNTALYYSKIKIAINSFSYFRSHSGSFTMSNKLNLYYDYARFFYIKNNFPHLLKKYKSLTWIRMKKSGIENPIYPLINEQHDVLFYIESQIQKFVFKIKNRLISKK